MLRVSQIVQHLSVERKINPGNSASGVLPAVVSGQSDGGFVNPVKQKLRNGEIVIGTRFVVCCLSQTNTTLIFFLQLALSHRPMSKTLS